MNRVFIEGKIFESQKLQNCPPDKGEYENCIFANCDFSSSDLSDINFLECEFRECNLSLSKLTHTSFRETRFINCKLLGLHFEDCNDLIITFEFDGCTLDLSSFYKLKIKGTSFSNSKINEVDFTETDLTNSSFNNCDLKNSVFKNTNLEGADLRSAFNYSIDPEINRIRKAKFSIPSVTGLLDKYDIEIDLH